MTLTKAHVIEKVQNKLQLPKDKSVELIESLLEIVKGALEKGEDVLVSGFGRFCVKEKKERRGRNPQTGKDMILGSRRVITFRCSGVLRDKINGVDSEG